MRWTTQSIVKALRARKRRGEAVSWRGLATADRALLSAATYHFGSLKAALSAAGIDYDDVAKRPRRTKDRIIQTLKAARRKGKDLSWGAATKRKGPLRLAAFAAVRLFKSWARALGAAGVDVDEWRRYQLWDKTAVAFEIRQRQANGDALNSGAVQAEDPALHAAAIRYFDSFDDALRAARVSPSKARVRKKAK